MTEFEQLQAENAQLKAHNRQLVEALEPFFEFSEALGNDIDDYMQITASYAFQELKRKAGGGSCYAIALTARAYRNAQKALQTPPAKLALAEAEVLRAAESLVRKVEACYVDDDTICYITSDLNYAVETMQEAKGDA